MPFLRGIVFLGLLLATSVLVAADEPKQMTKGKTEPKTVEIDVGPATLIDIGQGVTPFAETFAATIRQIPSGKVQVEKSRTGISKHLIILDLAGQKIGVFRSLGGGGMIEAEVLVFDPDNFFDLSPVVRVTLQQGKKKLEGYLQRFEASRPAAPSMGRASFVQQIQKVGILDILLADEDRHTGNLAIREGTLVPIDHNKTLLTVDADHDGLDVLKRLSEPPFWHRVYPRAANRPIWLSRREFLTWAQKPWTPASESFVKQWDAEKIAKELKERFGVKEGALGLMQAMNTWLKMGVAAGLTLEQVGSPIYNSKSSFQDVFHLARTARVEDALDFAGVEYDMLQAVELVRQQLRDAPPEARGPKEVKELFDASLKKLFERRIALMQGKLTATQLDDYLAEVWLNLLFQDEIHEWLRTHQEIPKERLRMMPCRQSRRQGSDAEAETPLPCVVDALQLAKKLTAARLEREAGSIATALREDLYQAFLVHFYYVSTLLVAKPGTEDYLRMAQFLRTQIDRSNELLISGVIWDADQNIHMSKMVLSDVISALTLTRKRALEEGEYYREKLGAPWMAFAAPKYVNDYLDKAQLLRRQLEGGQIDQARFDEEMKKE